jgi:hypothetical protein
MEQIWSVIKNGLRIIKIDSLNQIFTVTDSGIFPEIKHLDIFIGVATYAAALKARRQDNVIVWKVLN